MPKIKNLIGQKFNRLTVLEQNGRQCGKVVWKCRCDCGNEVNVIGSNLTSNKIKSCGCLKKEKQTQWGASTLIDITGKQYGELTVLSRAFDKEQEFKEAGTKKVHPIWKCKCSCGNITYVRGNQLKNGSIQSCGHIFSRGNQKILQVLQENNIKYKKEYTIRYNSNIYRYDFAILDNQNKIILLIEYDGYQHYYYDNRGWNTQENFIKQQETDKIKDKYAIINNIPLARIPYTDFDKINLEYLKQLFKNNNIIDF